MEHLLADEEQIVTLDFCDIFNENNTEMHQIDESELPEEVLQDILMNENTILDEVEAKPLNTVTEQKYEGRSTPDMKNQNRFKNVTKTDVDDIATKSCKKKTHKQTACGVKIFRGKGKVYLKIDKLSIKASNNFSFCYLPNFTIKTHYSKVIKIVSEWLHWTGLDVKFEEMSKETLANTLREFYPSASQSPTAGQPEGKPYAKQSLINIRSAISKHLQLPPHNKPWDLMNDKEFLLANCVFKG